MNCDDIVRMAQEALEDHATQYPHMQKGYTVDAITALRTAIEQAEKQEPVAWINWCAATGKRSVSFECESELASQPLYTTPPTAQREWVGLTAKDLAEIPPSAYEGAIWADAKLKEKNT